MTIVVVFQQKNWCNNSLDPVFLKNKGKQYLVWDSFRGIFGIVLTEDGLHVKGKFQIEGNAYEGFLFTTKTHTIIISRYLQEAG